MNKVQIAINKMNEKLVEMKLSADEQVKLSDNIVMDTEEHAMCQQLKSQLFAMGKMCMDDAQQLYTILGETPSHFKARSLAEKTVVMQIYIEMLNMKIAGKI